MPTSGQGWVSGCEIVEIASTLTQEFRQTARLFVWSTGIGEISAIDDHAIDLFCDRLGTIPDRYGTSAKHFDRSFDDAIESILKDGKPTRDLSTISRHRSRVFKLRKLHLSTLEERIAPGYRVDLDPAETGSISGWQDHCGFLAVTRLGRIVDGVSIPVFDSIRSAVDAEQLVQVVINQAREGLAATTEQGRAFVGTRHSDRILRIIPGFWAALEIS